MSAKQAAQVLVSLDNAKSEFDKYQVLIDVAKNHPAVLAILYEELREVLSKVRSTIARAAGPIE